MKCCSCEGYLPLQPSSLARTPLALALLLLCAACVGGSAHGEGAPSGVGKVGQEALHRGRWVATGEPHNVIKIGLLAPTRGSHVSEGASVRRGVEMAIAEANGAGHRFDLVVRPDDGAWGAGTQQIVRLAFDDGVCEIIGGVDSATAHLIEQVAQKARIVYLVPWASDRTLTQAGVPWIFRCAPHDDNRAEALGRDLFVSRRYRAVGIVCAEDRSARLAAEAFAKVAAKAGHPVLARHRWHLPVQEGNLPAVALAPLQHTDVDAIVLFAPEAMTTRIRLDLRKAHCPAAVFSPYTGTPISPAFRRRFQRRYGATPDLPAAYGYDAATTLIHALTILSPARQRSQWIRDAILHSQIVGATGIVRFDRKGNRYRYATP